MSGIALAGQWRMRRPFCAAAKPDFARLNLTQES
jgi:hypothetical protein